MDLSDFRGVAGSCCGLLVDLVFLVEGTDSPMCDQVVYGCRVSLAYRAIQAGATGFSIFVLVPGLVPHETTQRVYTLQTVHPCLMCE